MAFLLYEQKYGPSMILLLKTSFHRKRLSVTGGKCLPWEETSCHRKYSCHRKKIRLSSKTFRHNKNLSVTERNFLSQKDISCDGEKLPVTARNVLSQQEMSCHKKRFPVTLWHEGTSCPSKIILFVDYKILSQRYE